MASIIFGKLTGKWLVVLTATGRPALLPTGRPAVFTSQAAARRWLAGMEG